MADMRAWFSARVNLDAVAVTLGSTACPRIAIIVLSGTAPSGAEILMPLLSEAVKVPPSAGVKTAYALPSLSVSEVGIRPAGFRGTGVGSASVARVTWMVNVAMHGFGSESVFRCPMHIPYGWTSAVMV